MKMSPEFQRNLWLEMTQHRIIGMPTLLGAIFLLTYLIAGSHYPEPLQVIAMSIYFLLTLLWGTRLAGEALVTEVQDKTWDQQRLSSISPWAMSWGKLFGSTVFTWYGALCCLPVYIFAAWQAGEHDIIKTVLFMVVVSVFGQAVALLASLQSIKVYNRSATTGFMVAGLVVTFPIVSWGLKDAGYIIWYGNHYQPLDFLLIAVTCFGAWSLIGIHRRMRAELQFRNTPVYWLGFCIFMAIFISGFITETVHGQELMSMHLFTAYTTFIVLMYVMVIAEDKNPVIARRIVNAYQARAWTAFFENTPAWAVTLCGVYVLCLLLLIQASSLSSYVPGFTNLHAIVFAIALFVTRDVLLFIFFNMSTDRKRADAAAVFYLVVLYWLAPSILSGLNLSSLNAAFYPFGYHNKFVTIIAALVQVGVLVALIINRWHKLFRKKGT